MLPLLAGFLLFGCGSKPEQNYLQDFNPMDNPAEAARESAKHYAGFFNATVGLKKYRKQRAAIREQQISFSTISGDLDFLQSNYIGRPDSNTQKKVLATEGKFKAWEAGALAFIRKNNLGDVLTKYNAGELTPAKKQVPSESISSGVTLESEIRAVMEASEIPCLDLGKAESGCLWVYTLDNGRSRDGLAQSLCATASRFSIECVSIFDQNQKRLGRAFCN